MQRGALSVIKRARLKHLFWYEQYNQEIPGNVATGEGINHSEEERILLDKKEQWRSGNYAYCPHV